jgi:hypothetical protein
MLESASGKIVFGFHSRGLHMVLGPSKNGVPVRFKVRVNGASPGADHGSDSAADGTRSSTIPDVSTRPAEGPD